jgi:hypothetical protein
MSELVEFILWIGEWLLSWRLYVGFALTALACWLLVSAIPDYAARWIICSPLGLAGVFLSFRWQIRADLSK